METGFWGAAENWREDDLAELRHEFGLDAASAPREWTRNPAAWETARRADRMVDAALEFVASGYTTLSLDASDVEWLLETEIERPTQDGLALLRHSLLAAQGKTPPEASISWTSIRIPVVDLFTKLFLLRLGRPGMEWEFRGSVPRLIDVAAMPIPRGQLPAVVERYRRMAVEAYIQGHGPAALTWCRAALENSLKFGMAARGVHLLDATLFQRVRTAVVYGVVDPALERSAKAVFLRVGKTIHEDPTVVRDIVGTVRNTMILLTDMQRRGSNEG